MSSKPAETEFEDGPRPRAPRQMTVLINAAIVQGDDDGLCRVRNMSEGGMQIETALPLILDEPAVIVLHSGATFSCMPRWSRDGRTGMSCDFDPRRLLLDEGRAGETDVRAPWLPRFYRSLAVEIVAQGFVHSCLLESISTRDAVLTQLSIALEPGRTLTICIPRLGDFSATVRTNEDGNVCATFETPIGFNAFNHWLVPAPWTPSQSRAS